MAKVVIIIAAALVVMGPAVELGLVLVRYFSNFWDEDISEEFILDYGHGVPQHRSVTHYLLKALGGKLGACVGLGTIFSAAILIRAFKPGWFWLLAFITFSLLWLVTALALALSHAVKDLDRLSKKQRVPFITHEEIEADLNRLLQ